MLNKLKEIIIPAVFAVVVLSGAHAVFAQNMSGTVVEKRVTFARGKHSAILRGNAKYAMSYVYKLNAKAGQTMNVTLTGKNSELSFSIVRPDDETIEESFGVKEWKGELPLSGDYSVIIVMNDEQAKAGVPFTLNVEIK